MATQNKATTESVPVTRDSFVRAETDMYLPKQVEADGFGRLRQRSVEFERGEYRKLRFTRLLGALVIFLCATVEATHSQSNHPAAVIFENVRIFNGTSDRLSAPSNVLVVDNVIKAISTAPIVDPPATSVTRIQGVGRTLMPGLIDAHWHTMLVRPTPAALLTGDVGHLNLVAGAEATATLMRGFTTVRDMGGPAFGLKRAIDEGTVAGPRI
ncbi:MAG TPA: amidohydrolase family protein, partial [Candidatus Acidoferrum sp.]|nr:amidohydrolase family protein [Candidatus Acidoferrum sp.]